ncbi:MAG: hypothetical protein WA874_09660 [Chryseosolibacter sp.]
MKAATLNEIRKQLGALDSAALEQLCLALARYKKENKELLTYLLFEAGDEQAYVGEIRHEVDALFEALPKGNVYFIKKSIRKILRLINKQIRYSAIPATELEVRIYFCQKMKSAGIPLHPGTVLFNLYQQQLKKIQGVWSRLPEDLQFDYTRDIRSIAEK